MKLQDNGRYWLWEEDATLKQRDERLMIAQRGFKQRGLSIWGTENCQRCGACCYKFMIRAFDKPPYEMCEHLACSAAGASCNLHGHNKPAECAGYGCWNKRLKMGTDAERVALMRTAIDILHTKAEEDLEKTLN